MGGAGTLRVDFVEPKFKPEFLMERTLLRAIDITPSFLPDELGYVCVFGYDIMFLNYINHLNISIYIVCLYITHMHTCPIIYYMFCYLLILLRLLQFKYFKHTYFNLYLFLRERQSVSRVGAER